VGFKRSLDPANIWSQLSAYMDFEAPPEGFESLFVVSLFDQRQIAFYRKADKTEIILTEFTGRVREGFEDALDVDKLKEGGASILASGPIELQGRMVDSITFIGGVAAGTGQVAEDGAPGGLQGKILETFGLMPEAPPHFPEGTPILHLRFSGDSDSGGTLLVVRAPTSELLDAAALEALFEPFDLWSRVDSAPKPPPMTEDL
jgi:hypothetical protein